MPVLVDWSDDPSQGQATHYSFTHRGKWLRINGNIAEFWDSRGARWQPFEIRSVGLREIELALPRVDVDPADTSLPANDFQAALDDPEHAYHALATVLLSAYEQAAMGKGKERHAQARPFSEQPMQMASRLVGSADGLAYQAIKKIQESQRMPHDRAVAELLGAIVYTAGNVVFRDRAKGNRMII